MKVTAKKLMKFVERYHDAQRRIEELEYMLANCPDGPQ